jgi:hypothetical protein
VLGIQDLPGWWGVLHVITHLHTLLLLLPSPLLLL